MIFPLKKLSSGVLLCLKEDPLAYSCSPPSRDVLAESRSKGTPKQSSSSSPWPTGQIKSSRERLEPYEYRSVSARCLPPLLSDRLSF